MPLAHLIKLDSILASTWSASGKPCIDPSEPTSELRDWLRSTCWKNILSLKTHPFRESTCLPAVEPMGRIRMSRNIQYLIEYLNKGGKCSLVNWGLRLVWNMCKISLFVYWAVWDKVQCSENIVSLLTPMLWVCWWCVSEPFKILFYNSSYPKISLAPKYPLL